MTHVRIVINDTVEFDGELGEWMETPPEAFRDQLNPNSKPKPHLKAIMISVADALMQDRALDIEAKTRSYGWDLKVRYE